MAYVDVTDATFQAEVLDRSTSVPVVVDLWAEWCGPCKTLGPIIEKVVDATDGNVVLAKVDVDANPGISQAFRVQGIPAVFAIRDGQVVDSFVGAYPEHEVQRFVDSLLPTEAESEVSALVAKGDETSLRQALELEPGNEDAVVGLADLLVDSGDGDEALALLERIPESERTRRVAAAARLGSAPDDYDATLVGLLPRVKDDDEARQQFVDILELMGPDDPRTTEYRRRLTALVLAGSFGHTDIPRSRARPCAPTRRRTSWNPIRPGARPTTASRWEALTERVRPRMTGSGSVVSPRLRRRCCHGGRQWWLLPFAPTHSTEPASPSPPRPVRRRHRPRHPPDLVVAAESVFPSAMPARRRRPGAYTSWQPAPGHVSAIDGAGDARIADPATDTLNLAALRRRASRPRRRPVRSPPPAPPAPGCRLVVVACRSCRPRPANGRAGSEYLPGSATSGAGDHRRTGEADRTVRFGRPGRPPPSAGIGPAQLEAIRPLVTV